MPRPLRVFTGSLTPPIIICLDNHDYFINSDDTCAVKFPNPDVAPIGYELTVYASDDTQQGEVSISCPQGLGTDFRYNGANMSTVNIPSLCSATFKNMGNTWAVIAKG